MPQIKMYTTSSCGDCRAAKRFLSERNIPYEEINIEEVDGAASIVMQVNQGRRSVPTFDIDGRFVTCSPFDRRKLSEALGLKGRARGDTRNDE
ncbi:MAG: glutaredoxin family protein [Acidobacteria bacterium]|nr:glutaredoxin family protein [Acidobacteriota bacterium]